MKSIPLTNVIIAAIPPESEDELPIHTVILGLSLDGTINGSNEIAAADPVVNAATIKNDDNEIRTHLGYAVYIYGRYGDFM